jgi:hypothetical protein
MKRQPINTVEQAIAFLRTRGLETIDTAGGWILHGATFNNDDFELTCDTDAELIQYARDERDLCARVCAELGVASLAEMPLGESLSSTAVSAPSTHDRDGDSAGMHLEESKEDKK